MKKMWLVLVMIGICVIYFFSIQYRNEDRVTSSRKANIQRKFKAKKEQIINEGLKTPQSPVEINNEMMKAFYSRSSTKEDIESYVEITRMLYTEQLLSLNDASMQEEALLEEIENEEKAMYLLQSEIKAINTGQKDDETTIEVLYYTVKGDIIRIYTVKKEKDSWKIDGWENMEVSAEDDKTEE